MMRTNFFGLDDAGKTSVIRKLNMIEVPFAIPTMGFNVETIHHKGVEFTIWDVGGSATLRPLWNKYILTTKAIVFVVDASNRERLSEAKSELHRILQEPNLRNVSLLVLANKQDIPGAMSVDEVSQGLNLESIPQKNRNIMASSAKTGVGIWEGLDWLSSFVEVFHDSSCDESD